MDTDPYLRTSFWMVSIGLTTMWVSNVGVTPECIQRFMALPSMADAKKYEYDLFLTYISNAVIFFFVCSEQSGSLELDTLLSNFSLFTMV
jgi:hypothetical protein